VRCRFATAKQKLQKLLPSRSAHFGYVEHWAGQGKALFEEIKKHDLEEIVAKRAPRSRFSFRFRIELALREA
jgi:ATP-dependent DNA ligase